MPRLPSCIPALALAFCALLTGAGCSEKAPQENKAADQFKGGDLNRRYQLPELKGYVNLPEDWKAQVKLRPNWDAIGQKARPQDSATQTLDSKLIFEAKPSLEAWKAHLPRLEVYLDAPLATNLDLMGYFQKTGAGANEPGVKVVHAEKERLRIDGQSVLSTRRELEIAAGEKTMRLRQYIVHALMPLDALKDSPIGLTYILSVTGLDDLKEPKEKTLRAIMTSIAFQKH